MNDADALALCAFEEANLEPDDGLAAVARVVLNRAARRYQSDGAIAGTVFWPNAFSWTAYAMVGGVYAKVAHSPAAVADRAQSLLAQARDHPVAWARAERIAGSVHAGLYRGADYDRLSDAAVLYLNPAIANAEWARPEALICVIGRHHFFHA